MPRVISSALCLLTTVHCKLDKVVTVSADGHEFFERIAEYLSDDGVARVHAAWAYTCEKHAGQMRKTGEPYHTHPTTVAYYLAEYQLDSEALIAALLHDVAEDTIVTVPQIKECFGDDVGEIVDSVTKFKGSAENTTDQEAHEKTVSKILYSMTRDVRVALIKLFDRLHNMRTIGAMPQKKKERIARETLELYAPLANRLGMWQVKNELERLSFEITNPNAFQRINRLLQDRISTSRTLVAQVCARINRRLHEAGVDVVRVQASPRNVYTIYQKHKREESQNMVDHVPRILVVVKGRIACYTAIGLIHELWSPIPGEFDDYIARPRENLYRALHTTVRHERGNLLKIRLRTEAMAVVSEIGVLGRWADMGQDVSAEMATEMTEQVQALFTLIDRNISAESTGPETGVKRVLEDVLSTQITAYTPKGEPIELPTGATPLDFAYKIHTELGHRAYLTQVNGHMRPLNTLLRDGDTVNVLKRTPSPQRLWLDPDLGFVNTSNARSAIRRFFKRLPQRIAMRQGRQLLDAELAMLGMPDFEVETIAEWMGFETAEGLYHALGRADVLSTDVARRVLAQVWNEGKQRIVAREVVSAENETFIILGASDVHEALHLCRNCHPRPGDEIRGYIRKSRRVTVHQLDCHLLAAPDIAAGRLLELHWGEEATGQVREASIRIEVNDRPNLLYEITDLLRMEHINISWLNTPREKGNMRVDLCLDVISPRQLVELLHRFTTLVNVRSVRTVN